MSGYLILGAFAAAGDLLGSANYIRAVIKGQTRPHVFSWLIWALLAAIGTAIQLTAGSWGSALSLAVGGSISATIFVLGLRQGDHDISRSDWLALAGAVAAVPLWVVTANPFWAAALITAINFMASFPTFRKAWVRPEEENLRSFAIFSIISLVRTMAVSPFTFVVALYPAAITVFNMLVVLIILARRTPTDRKELSHGL